MSLRDETDAQDSLPIRFTEEKEERLGTRGYSASVKINDIANYRNLIELKPSASNLQLWAAQFVEFLSIFGLLKFLNREHRIESAKQIKVDSIEPRTPGRVRLQKPRGIDEESSSQYSSVSGSRGTPANYSLEEFLQLPKSERKRIERESKKEKGHAVGRVRFSTSSDESDGDDTLRNQEERQRQRGLEVRFPATAIETEEGGSDGGSVGMADVPRNEAKYGSEHVEKEQPIEQPPLDPEALNQATLMEMMEKIALDVGSKIRKEADERIEKLRKEHIQQMQEREAEYREIRLHDEANRDRQQEKRDQAVEKSKGKGSLYGAAGADVADSFINKLVERSPFFFIKGANGKWVQESDFSRQIRLVVWQLLEKKTPFHRHVTDKRYKGDILGAFRLLCTYGQENLGRQMQDTRRDLYKLQKTTAITYSEFTGKLEGLVQQLAAFGEEVTERERMMFFTMGLEHDVRYEKELRSITKRLGYTPAYEDLLPELELFAKNIDDLQPSGGRKKQNEESLDVEEDNRKHSKERDKRRKKEREQRDKELGRDPISDQDKAKLQCIFFFKRGYCRKGSECDMSHIKNEANVTTTPTTNKAAVRRRRPQQPCYEFEDKGSCSKGDNCNFSHIAETNSVEEEEVNSTEVTHTSPMRKRVVSKSEANMIEEVSVTGGRYKVDRVVEGEGKGPLETRHEMAKKFAANLASYDKAIKAMGDFSMREEESRTRESKVAEKELLAGAGNGFDLYFAVTPEAVVEDNGGYETGDDLPILEDQIDKVLCPKKIETKTKKVISEEPKKLSFLSILFGMLMFWLICTATNSVTLTTSIIVESNMMEEERPFGLGDVVEIVWENTPLHGAIGEIIEKGSGDRWRILLHNMSIYPSNAVKLARTSGISSTVLRYCDNSLPLRGETQEIVKQSDPPNLYIEANQTESSPYRFQSVADTGATKSFVKRGMCMEGTIIPLAQHIHVKDANGGLATCTEEGLIVMKSNVKDCTEQVRFMGNIVPNFSRMLISGPQLDDLGYYSDYGGGGLRIRKGPYGSSILLLPRLDTSSDTLITGTYSDDLPSGGPVDFGIDISERYRLYPIPDDLFMTKEELTEANVANTYSSSDDICALHQVLGHPNKHKLRLMWWWETGCMHREHNGQDNKGWCVCCIVAKINERTSQYNHLTASRGINDTCSVDVKCDLPRTARGFKHYLVVVEWHTNMVWIWLLKKKSDAKYYFLAWLRFVRTQQGKPMIHARMDCGECNAKIITDHCRENGTEITANISGFSRGNPKAEAMIKSIDESRRASMFQANAHSRNWDFAVANVPNQHNRQPNGVELRNATTNRLVKGTKGKPSNELRPLTPIEKWTGIRAPSYKSLRRDVYPFGSKCVSFISPKHRPSAADPGYEAIYLCPIRPELMPRDDQVRRPGHLVMDNDKVVRWTHRVSVNLTEFPWRRDDSDKEPPLPMELPKMEPFREKRGDESQIPYPPYSLSLDSDMHPMQPIEIKPSGIIRDDDTLGESDSSEESDLDDLQDGEQKVEAEKEASVPLRRGNRTNAGNLYKRRAQIEALEKESKMEVEDGFKAGMKVQTPYGVASYQHTTPTGQIAVTYDSRDPAHVGVWMLKKKDVWLGHERSWRYNIDGERIDAQGTNIGDEVNSVELEWVLDHDVGPANLCMPLGGTGLLADDSVFDDWNHTEIGKEEALPADDKDGKEHLDSPVKLKGSPKLRSYTLTDLRKLEASVVEGYLPSHHHQTYGHPMEKLIRRAEAKELQGMLNIPIIENPIDEYILDEEGKPEIKSIPLMWVYTAKPAEGKTTFFCVKARLTMMGNYEKTNLSALEATAPVAMPSTYRILMALHIGEPDVEFRTMDVAQAYLSTEMKRVVHIRHPPGYEFTIDEFNGTPSYEILRRGERPSKTKSRLLRALYGGMECGRLFYEKFVDTHLQMSYKGVKFTTMAYDRCVLIIQVSDDEYIKIVFHVDDSLIVKKGEELWKWYTTTLGKTFKFIDNAFARFLGLTVRVDYTLGRIEIYQIAQIKKMLRQFGLDTDKTGPAISPMESGSFPTLADVPLDQGELAKVMASFDMQGCVGHLSYLQFTSRPEISRGLKLLSSCVRAYGEKHIKLAFRVMRWLKGAMHIPLVIQSGFARTLQIFTDASHAGCPDTRRSLTGVVMKLGGNTVFWLCVWQRIISHSSCESELMALDRGATIGLLIQRVSEFLGAKHVRPVDVFVDNQSTIDISGANPLQLGRNLHVHARFFFIKQLVGWKDYAIWHLPSGEQVADIMVTFKGTGTFNYLFALVMGCARIQRDRHRSLAWNVGYLSGMEKP